MNIKKRMQFLYAAGIFISLLGLSHSVTAQSWIELAPSGSPPDPLFVQKPAFYHAASNRLIVFFPGKVGLGGFGNQVWVLTNANGLGGAPTWIQLTPTGTAPNTNGLNSAAYDATNNRLIVYGGCFANCSPALSEVFALSNANGLGGAPVWSQLTVTNPQARVDNSLVYDCVNNLAITFGGHFAFYGTDQNDTRTLSNANGLTSPSSWSTLSVSGGTPGVRGQHTAVYDQGNNRMTIFAGQNLIQCCYVQSDYNDVWTLSNANGIGGTPTWTQLSPMGSLPQPRSGHSAVYDSANNRMIIFGGSAWNQMVQSYTPLGDLWQLSNANGSGGTPTWTQIMATGTAPTPRSNHTAAFDAANQRMILLGGRNDSEMPMTSNRVWVLILNRPPVASCQNMTVSVGVGCTADASIDNGSSDPDGDTISLMQTPPGPYPLGMTNVTLSVTDSKGASSQCMATVTVVDTTPPTITCPANITATTANPGAACATVTYMTPTASDNCPNPAVNCVPPSGSCFPAGVTTVTCTASDGSGNPASCSFTISVFNMCVQDDTNPAAVLLFNTFTGAYRFCCGGTIFTGVGIATQKGGVYTLTHSPADRRVSVKIDTLSNTSSASLQSPPGVTRCSITDRNIRNNSCICN
jgi:hypothetical protein